MKEWKIVYKIPYFSLFFIALWYHESDIDEIDTLHPPIDMVSDFPLSTTWRTPRSFKKRRHLSAQFLLILHHHYHYIISIFPAPDFLGKWFNILSHWKFLICNPEKYAQISGGVGLKKNFFFNLLCRKCKKI